MFKKVLMPEMMSEVLQQVTKHPRERIDAIERGVKGDVSYLVLDIWGSPDVRCSSSITKTLPFSPRSAWKLTFNRWRPLPDCFRPPTSNTRARSWTSQSKRRG